MDVRNKIAGGEAMGRLQGKVAVVMGAGSSGPGWSNGKAVAATYAREGAKVVAVDFDLARAEETAQAIAGEGHLAKAFRADATQEADVEAVMAFAIEQFGALDILHNNIGSASDKSERIHEHSLGNWDRELAVTLKTGFLGMKAAIPHMLKAGGGAIVNTSSIAAVRPLTRGSNASYAAAKAGIEAITKVAASDYGPDNIRVNCVRIGYADTPLVRGLYLKAGVPADEVDGLMLQSGKSVPLRNERTTVWDVANAALFLASDEAKHITGVILNVDGGLDVAQI
jgi:NAD(P)-dependent dehydrogenase (short-subunit alcohol dehydrogenase family)